MSLALSKARSAMVLAAALPIAAAARAETAVEPGLWEKTETVTVDGKASPSRPDRICLTQDDASLQRLLLMKDDEAAVRGCTSEATQPAAGVVRMSMSCPARDDQPAVAARLEVRFTATAFEGTGSVEIRPKDGPPRTGTSTLSGKRLGDC